MFSSKSIDNLNVDKLNLNRLMEPKSKRICRKSIDRSNHLEIIPEGNTNNVTNLNNVNEANDVYTYEGVNNNTEGDNYLRKKPTKLNKSGLTGNRGTFHLHKNLNSAWQTERKLSLRHLRSEDASAVVSLMPAFRRMTFGKCLEQNRSFRNNSELKSGALVWISHGDLSSVSRTNRNESNTLTNNSNYHDLNKVPSRIPVTVKVYQSTSGCFALMTPSRCQRDMAQPIYLGLRRSRVTIENCADSQSVSSSGTPCYLILTLSGRGGKNFKFEASSKASAEEWAQVLSSETIERAKPSMCTRVVPLTQTKPGITVTDNNNNIDLEMDVSRSTTSSSFTTTKVSQERNRIRLSRVNQTQPCFSTATKRPFNMSRIRKDGRMPTLSESSDENDEDFSERD